MAEVETPQNSAMDRLKLVDPPKALTMNVLLYGQPKTGKTAAALSGPEQVLLVNADLANATMFARDRFPNTLEVEAGGLQVLYDVVHALREDKGETIKTVVVDPIGELYRRLLEEISGGSLHPTLPQRGDVTTHIERFCRALCTTSTVNTVLVCHEVSGDRDESTGVIDRLPFTGTSNPNLGAKLMGMVDVIGYTGLKVPEGGGDPQYVAQLAPGGGRRGGTRFDLGAVRETNLTEWVEAANAARKSNNPTKEK